MPDIKVVSPFIFFTGRRHIFAGIYATVSKQLIHLNTLEPKKIIVRK